MAAVHAHILVQVIGDAQDIVQQLRAALERKLRLVKGSWESACVFHRVEDGILVIHMHQIDVHAACDELLDPVMHIAAA